MITEGRLFRGSSGAATEFGHVSVDSRGRRCACGKRGCAETYVSASGVRRTVYELLASSNEPSALRGVTFNDLTAELVARLAIAGDPIAREAFEVTGEILGRLLANAVAVVDPEAIVLGGGLMNAGEILMKPVRMSFDEHVLDRYKTTVQLFPSAMQDGEAGILGAASVAMRGILQ
jgi:glucokinase